MQGTLSHHAREFIPHDQPRASTSTATATATAANRTAPSLQERGDGSQPRRGSRRRRNKNRSRAEAAATDVEKSDGSVEEAAISARVASEPECDSSNLAARAAKAQRPRIPRGAQRRTESRTSVAPSKMPSGANRASDLKSALIDELRRESYECLVCIDLIKTTQPVWSCKTCWAVFHLPCIQKWAKSNNKSESVGADAQNPLLAWRCPGCQTTQHTIPEKYLCFCGKTQDPTGSALATPHSCSNSCGRLRHGGCQHADSAPCHPGPCEKCNLRAPFDTCFCGKKKIALKCSEVDYALGGISCQQTCGRPLTCGVHRCERTCHPGSCGICTVTDLVQCYCGRAIKEMACSQHGKGLLSSSLSEGKLEEWHGHFQCDSLCSKPFACGRHNCQKKCHSLNAKSTLCPRDPSTIQTCPCGRTNLTTVRQKCTDPIPTCGKTCLRRHETCGHECQKDCHDSPCPPCQVELTIPCRCGQSDSPWKCSDYKAHNGPVLCHRKCAVIRNCGKHQCGRRCCPLAHLAPLQVATKSKKGRQQAPLLDEQQDPEHLHECLLQCGKLLSCKNHHCAVLDHRGPCPPCLLASFEEVACHCGLTVLLPPVPCGMRPQCDAPCIRASACGHAGVQHQCHADDIACPPCPFLVAKACNCGKSVIKNVPCHRSSNSCGEACGRLLDCGAHRCTKICHSGDDCERPCEQACGKPRKGCGHPHLAKCHAPLPCDCKTESCQALVSVPCPCGHLTKQEICGGREDNVVLLTDDNKTMDRNLKCNAHCELEQRNKRLAFAFGMDQGSRLPTSFEPTYEQSILSYASADIAKARAIEGMLTDFLGSGKKNVCLPPMNGQHRKFVHELANHFALGAEAVDSEPHRSVLIHRKIESKVPSILPSDLVHKSALSARTNEHREISKPSIANLKSLKKETHEVEGEKANAIYIEGIFGLDEASLSQLIRPFLQALEFDILWQSTEDCIVLFHFGPNVPSATRDSQIRSARSDLRLLAERAGTFVFAEAAYWDAKTSKVVWRESTRSTPKATVEAAASLIPTLNAFQILDRAPPKARMAWGATPSSARSVANGAPLTLTNRRPGLGLVYQTVSPRPVVVPDVWDGEGA